MAVYSNAESRNRQSQYEPTNPQIVSARPAGDQERYVMRKLFVVIVALISSLAVAGCMGQVAWPEETDVERIIRSCREKRVAIFPRTVYVPANTDDIAVKNIVTIVNLTPDPLALADIAAYGHNGTDGISIGQGARHWRLAPDSRAGNLKTIADWKEEIYLESIFNSAPELSLVSVKDQLVGDVLSIRVTNDSRTYPVDISLQRIRDVEGPTAYGMTASCGI